MNRQAAIVDAMEAAQEASLRPERWPEAVAALCAVFHIDCGALYVEMANPHQGPYGSADNAIIHGFEDRMVEAYLAHFSAINPFTRFGPRLIGGGALTNASGDLAKLPDQEGYPEFLNDWARPQGLHHLVGETIRGDVDQLQSIALWRGADVGAFSEEELRDFNRLSRNIRRSIEIGERLGHAAAIMRAVGEPRSGPRVGVFRLSPSGRAEAANSYAETLLRSRNGLQLVKGRLRALWKDDQPALDRLLREPNDLLPSGVENAGGPGEPTMREPASAVLRGRHRHERLRISVLRAPPVFERPGFDCSLDRLLLVEAAPPIVAMSMTDFDQARLSGAETRLVGELLAGGSLREISERLGVRYETARSQLKSVFGKTGTRRQSELVALAMKMRD